MLDTATCLHCNYPLRGLPEPRCPECGNGFDPHDPRTYRARRVPEFVARWLSNVSRRTDRGRWWTIALLVWGGSALAGGILVLIVAIALAAAFFFTRALESYIKRMIARAYGVEAQRERRSALTWCALVAVAVLVHEDALFRLAVRAHAPLLRSYAHRAYEVEPFVHGYRRNHVLGLLLIHSHVQPSGVMMYVGPGWSCSYDGELHVGEPPFSGLPR